MIVNLQINKCYKFYKDYIKFDTEQADNTKSVEL